MAASTWISASTDAAVEAAVAAIRSSRAMVALAIAGGGSGVIPRLLTRPGASRTVLEAQAPYCRRALTELLGADAGVALLGGNLARACAGHVWAGAAAA